MNLLRFSTLMLLLGIGYSFSHDFIDEMQNELAPGAKLWALLIAGSNTWMNYRHQADVCHSYQVLHNHGIPDERIVVMMYDDLANNEENPTKGIVINHPNGNDVYKGVPHDYTKDTVTPENFLNILQGNEEAMQGIGSGKVIQSGPNDHVFVYFADHGAPGLIAFPESELMATDLNNAIKSMYNQNKYGKMVFYIEACESGSMFKKLLPNNINVYATTAANPTESSYACYYDDARETYLGDVYSVKWLEDSDKEVLSQETLKKQFQVVKKETNTSHVQEYGNLTISSMHVSEFQGSKSADPIILPTVPLTSMPSREVPLAVAKHKLMNAATPELYATRQKQLTKLLRNRDYLHKTMIRLVDDVSQKVNTVVDLWNDNKEINNFECYENVIKYFDEECFRLSKNPYTLEYLYLFVNMCENYINEGAVMETMDRICVHPPIYGIM